MRRGAIISFWQFVKVSKRHVLKTGKHCLCLEGKEKTQRFFASICFHKITKECKNRGFSRHRGKPKMAFLVSKMPFWKGASRGGLLSLIHKSCALLKTLFLMCFQKKHSLAEIKRSKLKKHKFTKIGGCLPTCKKVFFVLFVCLLFGGFVFSWCFCSFCL